MTAFIRHGVRNGRLEAPCGHLRMLSRSAYGLASSDALLAMGYLYGGGGRGHVPMVYPSGRSIW